MVTKYGSQFQLMMAAKSGKTSLVRFAKDESDAGLYLHGFHGSLGTPLAARGSVAELEALLKELT